MGNFPPSCFKTLHSTTKESWLYSRCDQTQFTVFFEFIFVFVKEFRICKLGRSTLNINNVNLESWRNLVLSVPEGPDDIFKKTERICQLNKIHIHRAFHFSSLISRLKKYRMDSETSKFNPSSRCLDNINCCQEGCDANHVHPEDDLFVVHVSNIRYNYPTTITSG